jgi:hypothetical protein
MEELGLTGWLPGSGRRLAVRTTREGVAGVDFTRASSMQPTLATSLTGKRQSAVSIRSPEASRTMAWLVVTAIGAVTAVALASLFTRRR